MSRGRGLWPNRAQRKRKRHFRRNRFRAQSMDGQSSSAGPGGRRLAPKHMCNSRRRSDGNLMRAVATRKVSQMSIRSGFFIAGAMASTLMMVSSAWAAPNACASFDALWFSPAECRHPQTNRLIGNSGGGGTVQLGGDRYVTLLAGAGAGLEPVEITLAQVVVRDSDGNFVGDCNPKIDDPDGGIISLFGGFSEPECDEGVTHETVVAFEE
jgi:hypothetical protein